MLTGTLHLPHEALVGLAVLTVGVIVEGKGITAGIAAGIAEDIAGSLVRAGEERIRHVDLPGGKLLAVYGERQGGDVVDKVEVILVALVIGTIADHVHDLGAGVQQVVNIVLDVVEGDDSLPWRR